MRYAWAAVAIVGMLAASVGVGGGYFLFNLQNTQFKLEEAKSQTKALQEEVRSLQEKESKLVAERNSIEAKITTLLDKFDAVNTSLTSNRKENQDLKMQVSDLRIQLQEVAAGLGVRIEEIRSSSKVQDAQIVNATRQVEESKKQIADMGKQIADLRKELAVPRDQQKPSATCSPGDVVFEEDFEYTDAITNHGWVGISTAGIALTQAGIVAEGGRALKLDDISNSAPNSYVRALPILNGNFQIDYYIRTEQYGQTVLLALLGDQGVVDGQLKGIRTELSDNINRGFFAQNTPYFVYQLNKWYHIRLVVRTQSQSFDIYVDDMDKPLATNLKFLDRLFNTISIHTATAGVGPGYWDNIVVRCLP